MEGVELENQSAQQLDDQGKLYLKKLLVETVNPALNVFNEAKNRKIDYVLWVEQALHISLYKELFKNIMQVKGKVELRPFSKSTTEPALPMTSSYLRLPIT